MLSQSNIDRINKEIKKELRNYGSVFCNTPEKMEACLDRIAALKTLLYPQPTQEEILSQLAEAFVGVRQTPQPVAAPAPLETLIDALVRRY